MVQERQGRGFDNDMVTFAPHVQAIEGFEWAGGLTGGGAKGREIMQADQQLGRFVHGLRIHIWPDPPYATLF